MCRHFYPIATRLHAAPVAGVVFGRIVKIQNAGGIPAFFDQRKVSPTEQVARDFGQRNEKVVHGSRCRVETLLKPAFPSDELRVSGALGQDLVDEIDG
jgi:hypothetical protein